MIKKYTSKLSRRDSLQWLGSMVSVVVVGGVVVACDTPEPKLPDVKQSSHWPDLKFEPITGPKYGQDPDLIDPTTPWSRTLTPEQLNLTARLCDIICPRDSGGPSARDVGVPEVIDEWVSAPYESQQNHRILILNGFQWLDDEAERRFGHKFMTSSEIQQIEIVDDIAFAEKESDPVFEHAVLFFERMRILTLGGYFTSPEGKEDLGYMGNVPILGDYPGPSKEAHAHLNDIIANLT